MRVHEYIVVGSGCTGAMAAQTLVDAGAAVLMLDVGTKNTALSPIPNKDFLTIRRTEANQSSYFLGDKLEGVSWGAVGKSEQVTPARKHMQALVDKLLPVDSYNFSPVESLGYGGLGIGWGIGCWEWSAAELGAAGLNPKSMRSAYDLVSKRIGISATKDGAADYTIGPLKSYQKSPHMDRNHRRLFANYLKKQHVLQNKGFVMGRTPLALLTEDTNGRKKYSYKEMDFYSDNEQSAYRPWMTVDKLKKQPGFEYVGEQLVVGFEEQKDRVAVHCLDTETQQGTTFYCKKLILASGVFGTARIVLRSFRAHGVRLPLLCNPYSYAPCIQPAFVGQEAERRKLGFAQLSLFLDESGSQLDTSMASLYSYQSLMLFRMVRQVPLGLADTRVLLRYLSSGLIIMGIHQPDKPSPRKYIELVSADATSPTGDKLQIEYALDQNEQRECTRREKKYVGAMRSLGAYAITRIDPGFGSSIHYAGPLPFSTSEQQFTLATNGRLHKTRRIFVADGSGFTYLAGKGLTFSLMANAHNVAQGALHYAI